VLGEYVIRPKNTKQQEDGDIYIMKIFIICRLAYSSPDIIRMMVWTGYVTRMNTEILVGKPESRR
jgi:hypothetical protein